MTNSISPELARFYAFFETTGLARLDGLDASYFRGLTDSEKQEAWNFLEKNLKFSVDSTCGLCLINPEMAVEKFKEHVRQPLDDGLYPEERRELEENRLLMLHLILSREPSPEYAEILTGFSASEFGESRAKFAEYLPVANVSERSLNVLKTMIFTETVRIALSCAASKFMAIWGYNFEFGDERYKALYRRLTSSEEEEKKAAIQQIENERSI
ncbi:hypothetical protein GTP56_13035 [Duganella sp. FT134W]|uniref:Uncharacterized protein n=1 Tax=Duganella margarita TaxID=2692170 RepID=A0A7X4H1Y4_9BURK|nr:hypothetical protein [Duganella margarita]MYM73114.1 hypothetical protein [Duganella margarita]